MTASGENPESTQKIVRIDRDRLWTTLMDLKEISSEHGDISHTPREYSNAEACGNGTGVLPNAVLRLADQP